MSDPVNNLLSRLECVIDKGHEKWMARCPAHDDRNPSLSIARGDDGRVLLKCWAGCSAFDVVQALGLSLSDLFVKPAHRLPPGRKRLYPNYRHILELIKHEILIVVIVAELLKNNQQLNERGIRALNRAYDNLSKVLEVVNV